MVAALKQTEADRPKPTEDLTAAELLSHGT
jgi:hypothetical protein